MNSLPITVGKNQKLLPVFNQIKVFLNRQDRIPLDPSRRAGTGGEKPGGALIGICPAGGGPKLGGPNGGVSKLSSPPQPGLLKLSSLNGLLYTQALLLHNSIYVIGHLTVEPLPTKVKIITEYFPLCYNL